ncbi:uncharacterized protein VP01_729g6 [Puccinia sorghi]|uniref:SEC7 domain-containing protein n=1 Tax=Puccinia sorghi TaxID=27349 RepID=A0A0L6UD19_9BASI|nr:uncharacterized protein VP01_729g6 [Puccinia sorghi]
MEDISQAVLETSLSSRASRSRHAIKRLVQTILTNTIKPNKQATSRLTSHEKPYKNCSTTTTTTTTSKCKMKRSKSYDNFIQPNHSQLTITKTRSNSLTSLPTNNTLHSSKQQHITTTNKVLPQLFLPQNNPTLNTRSNQPRRATLDAHPVPKLKNRTSTPLFQLLADDKKQEEEKNSPSRPPSSLSHASNHSLLKRIKAGVTPKSSLTSPSPFERSLITGLARSTLSYTSTETMGSNHTDQPSESKPFIGPSRSSTDVKESLNPRPVMPLYRSHSDSVSQQRSAIEELRTNNNKNNTSPRKHSTKHSHGTPSIPREHTRETSLYHRRNSQQPRKIRKPITSPAFLNQPVIEIAKSDFPIDSSSCSIMVLIYMIIFNLSEINHDQIPQADDPGPDKKLKPLERSPEDESEEAYLVRLSQKIEKSKIPSVLASSPNPFHSSALTKYMSTFEFSHDPIDLSIRKLLMVVDLPSETQQIDRVIESFSKQYTECNPKLFDSHDQVYILAFSIIMLHTDAFNKSNKAKMTRADYVKNTKMDGVPTELLEHFLLLLLLLLLPLLQRKKKYIYDNVTYTPFVYVDPERDITGQKISGHSQQASDHTGSSFFGLGGNHSNYNHNSTSSMSSSSILPGTKDSKSKLDPYQLIAKGSTHELRLDLGAVIPSRNPFSFTGSVSWFDFKRLRESFNPAKSVMIQVVNLAPAKTNSILRQIETDDFVEPGNYNSQEHSPPADHSSLKRTDDDGSWNEPKSFSPAITSTFTAGSFLNLRAIKVGLVHLRIDAYTPFTTPQSDSPENSINEVSMSKNVISKKWKLFCILLTARQLILLKDVGLAAELQESIKLAGFRNRANPEDQLVVRITGLKPDLVLSLDGGVALMDSFVLPPPHFSLSNLSLWELTWLDCLLMGVDDTDDMNSWISAHPFRILIMPPRTRHIDYHFGRLINPCQAHLHRRPCRLRGPPTTTSSESLPSSSSSFNRKNQHPRDNDEISSARPSIDRPMVSRSTSRSHSLSARPFDIGPSFIGESPRSSSAHSRLSSTTNNLPTHWDRVKAQIMMLEGHIVTAKTELNDNLRLARNLAVLTPFQLSTRSRLQQSIMPVANRVKNSRCQLSKLVCYREVLMRDLALGIAAINGSAARTTTPSGPSGVHETPSTVDHEPAFRSTSQPRNRAAQSLDQPQEILIQTTKRTSQDDGYHGRRGASLEGIRQRSSTPRRASDIIAGRNGCHTSLGNHPPTVEWPLFRHSPIPPPSTEKNHRRSLSGSHPKHTAQVNAHLKDSGTKLPEDTASLSSPEVKHAARLPSPSTSRSTLTCAPSTGRNWTSGKRELGGEEGGWERMASLRKVGRHAVDESGLADGVVVVEEQEERSGGPVGSQDMLPSSSRSLARSRSATSKSARSLVLAAESPVVSAGAVEPVMSDRDCKPVSSSSARSPSNAPILSGSVKGSGALASGYTAIDMPARTASIAANPSHFRPPVHPLLLSSPSPSASSSSSCAPPSSARVAARARMLAKAQLIASSSPSSSSSTLEAIFHRPITIPSSLPDIPAPTVDVPTTATDIPTAADSAVHPIAAISTAHVHPHPSHSSSSSSLNPSSSLVHVVAPSNHLRPSSPLPNLPTPPNHSSSLVADSHFVLRHGKRFTQAWGLP